MSVSIDYINEVVKNEVVETECDENDDVENDIIKEVEEEDEVENEIIDETTDKEEPLIFNKVLTTPFYNPNVGDDRPITLIANADDIIKSKNIYLTEFVGGDNNVKPYFDAEFYENFSLTLDEVYKIQDEKDNECLNLINDLLKEYKITITKCFKEPRDFTKEETKTDENGKKSKITKVYLKISMHYIVKWDLFEKY